MTTSWEDAPQAPIRQCSDSRVSEAAPEQLFDCLSSGARNHEVPVSGGRFTRKLGRVDP